VNQDLDAAGMIVIMEKLTIKTMIMDMADAIVMTGSKGLNVIDRPDLSGRFFILFV